MSEMQIIRGQGPYEKQSTKTNVWRPLLVAGVYAALIVCIYAPAVYLEAVLVGFVFGPALVGGGLAQLLKVSRGDGLEIRWRKIDAGKRLVAGLLVAVGALCVYLRVIDGWPWAWSVAAGRLWIGTPWIGFSVPAAWLAARVGLVLALPLALIPAGIALLSRFLMEIGFPNLADSVRAQAGQLLDRRSIHYPARPEVAQPAAVSNRPAEGGSL